MTAVRRHPAPASPTVALLPWGDVIEDYLDGLGVALQAFCEDMAGGWLFGYVDALRRVGVRTVVICVSRQVQTPARFTNAPTGAAVWVLPAPAPYLNLRSRMRDPYGWTLEEMFGAHQAGPRWRYRLLRNGAPYLATPLRALAGVVRRERCTAILCQEYESPRFDVSVVLGRLLRLPVFATFQGGTWQRVRVERRLRPLALRACAGLVIAPRAEADRVRALYGSAVPRIARIFNPLDVSRWFAEGRCETRADLGIPSTAEVVAWHGRVDVHRKGLDVLLEAWQTVRTQRPGRALRLLLVGTGDDAGALRARICEKHIQDVVWVDRYVLGSALLRRYLSAADVYVFPSRHEGFPVAPLEAMACRLPVVAAAAPGIADIFETGEASGGLVVPCGDGAALAEALACQLDDPARRRAMGKQARRRVETAFSPEVVGAQLLAFFKGSAGT